MGNVQKMHNDLERSGESDRRRLESQMQSLDSQTYDANSLSHSVFSKHRIYRQDLKAQLNQERDSVRHISLQKEIELKELQVRLDGSVCSHDCILVHPHRYCVVAGAFQDARVPYRRRN